MQVTEGLLALVVDGKVIAPTVAFDVGVSGRPMIRLAIEWESGAAQCRTPGRDEARPGLALRDLEVGEVLDGGDQGRVVEITFAVSGKGVVELGDECRDW